MGKSEEDATDAMPDLGKRYLIIEWHDGGDQIVDGYDNFSSTELGGMAFALTELAKEVRQQEFEEEDEGGV